MMNNNVRNKLLKDIAGRLIDIRKHFNQSIPEMAKILEMDASTYRKHEYGISWARIETLSLLQKKFDISMDWLLFNKGAMFFKSKSEEIKKIDQEKKKIEEFEKSFPTMNELKLLFDDMKEDPVLQHNLMLKYYDYKREKLKNS